MSGIIYAAVDRGQLITSTSPDHAEGESYSIDVKLQNYTEQIETPKKSHVSIGGNVETVLKRAVKIFNVAFIWPDTENADIEEWLYSIAAGESFTFDAYGTIASEDNQISVVCTNAAFSINRLSHGSEHWRRVSLTLRDSL